MTAYEIQAAHNGRWTNDATILGDGLNSWPTKDAALAAMDELISTWPDATLRVVAINA